MKWFAILIAGLLPVVLAAPCALAVNYTWDSDNGGNWDDTTVDGWNAASFPKSNADTALFSADLTADRTIVVNVSNAAMFSLTLTDTSPATPFNWIISATGGNTLLLDRASGTPSITSNSGANLITAGINIGATSSSASLAVAVNNSSQLTLSGAINEGAAARGLSVSGTGTVILSSSNNLTGGWNLGGAAASGQFNTLQFSNPGALGTGSTAINFNVSAGTSVLDYTGTNNGSTTRGITTGNGAGVNVIQVTGVGTYSFSGAITNNSTSGNKVLTFRGTNAGANTLSGNITNGSFTMGITKAEAGTWVLAPASGTNTYTGTTTINGGVLRGVDAVGISSTSNVNINGGVWESSSDIVRAGGSSAGQMRITSSIVAPSGFSARGNAINVAFGTLLSPTALTWGTAPFQPVSSLLLNEATANNTLDFKNAINLGSAQRGIDVSAATAILSGAISNAAGGIDKGGAGTLVLSNTLIGNSYGGATNVNAGTFLMDGTHTGAGNYTVAAGATLGGNSTNITLATGKSITLNNAGVNRSKLAPGNNGIGKLTINTAATGTGNVNLSGANYLWEIGSLTDAGAGNTGAGTNFDQLALLSGGATTTLQLGGTLTVMFNGVVDPNDANLFWDSDHTWKVIDVTGATTTGAITVANGNGWADGRGFISFVGNGITGDTGDVYVSFTTVPEPASLSLAAAGVCLLARRRRVGGNEARPAR
jgi:autotransporter-associated beta strand protein